MSFIRSRLPKGFAWNVRPGGQLDSVLNVVDEILNEIALIAGSIAWIRDPFKCLDVDALSIEYGAPLFNTGGDLTLYRQLLSTFVYTPYRTGSDSDLQTVLNNAGFTAALVVKNNKGQDPRPLYSLEPVCVVGGTDAFIGGDDDYIGDESGYDVLVNGPLFDNQQTEVGYDIGDNPDLWGGVDFVCGGVTYDGNGFITSIDPVVVSLNLKETFENLILRTKPLHNWIVMAVDYISPSVIAQTGDETDPTIAQTGDETDPTIAQTGV
jgi:hypothetical protein